MGDESPASFVDYPVPLRQGTVMARLRLPIDFAPTDIPAIRGVLYAIADAYCPRAAVPRNQQEK
jgi:hypothetical protein